MDWSLLAGGVSQGLNNAQQGVNQGLLQGEGVRAQRAAEGLQQQHFGLQQQQLAAHLAQQQVQNQLAREHLGLQSQQLGALRDYHSGMLGYHGRMADIAASDEARKQALAPYEMDYRKAGSEWMRGRGGLYSDRTEAMYDRTGAMREHWDRMHEDAQARLGVLQGRLRVYQQQAAKLSPGAQLAMKALEVKSRDLGRMLNAAGYAAANGQQWKGPSIPEIYGQMQALEEQAAQLAQRQPGGNPQTGQPTPQFDPRRYNLKPMVAPGG